VLLKRQKEARVLCLVKVRERETRSLDVEETQVGEGRLLVVDDGSLSLYWCVQTCGQEERMCGQLSE
jgi:hypothetical protein